MKDKQIIDGVDVSGCPNFTFNKIVPYESICISEQSAMCVNNKDCLYKKYKRKEQECEILKSTLKKKTEDYNKLAVNYDAYEHMAKTQFNKKEQECEKLEYRLKNIEEFRHDYCMNCEDLLKPTHSCCGCNMSILRHLIEEQI